MYDRTTSGTSSGCTVKREERKVKLDFIEHCAHITIRTSETRQIGNERSYEKEGKN